MYKTVIILVEGQSEETFIRDTVAPAFWPLNIFLETRNFAGNVNFDRFCLHIRNILGERDDTIISTMLDLYRLDKHFPGYLNIKSFPDVYQKVVTLEQPLHDYITVQYQCRPGRFIPYIQPYEFEGLLFSDINALIQIEPAWEKQATKLQAIRSAFETPEHINNSYETRQNNSTFLSAIFSVSLITVNKPNINLIIPK